MRLPLKLFVLLIGATLLLAACGGGNEPTPTPTKTPVAAQAQATPTPTIAPASNQTDSAAPAQPTAPSAPQPTPTPQQFARVAVDQLNIRSGPGTQNSIVRLASAGETFLVLGRSDDGAWLQLAENGAPLGWGAAEFMTLVDQAAEASSTTGGAAQSPSSGAGGFTGSFAPATMTSPDYGVQVFVWWREEIRDRDLDLVKDAGFNWVKQTFSWEAIEGAGRGRFDWSIADQVVSHANARGLKILARLSLDPEVRNFWAGDPPQNGDAFAEFAGALARRYNCQPGAVGCIQAYQIWNEPNLAREWGGKRPNPVEYVQFLGKAYRAIKAANPNAIVISAGMAPTGDDNEIAMPDDLFYERMYQAMGGSSNGYFDALGVHGAGYAAPPELDPEEAARNPRYGGHRFFAFRHVENIRRIMEKYGDGNKQIVLLEFGWTFDPVNPAYKWHGADAGIDMFVQADYLKRAYQYAAANWRPWIGLMSALTMPNLDWLSDGNPQDEEQYWWALMEPSPIDALHWRPAYIELCIYLNSLKGQRCKYDPNP
ncbi:SH3 domain-containing protein [Caldilinea sp.]|uniref:SH3 domain-containing protein n=1 Tax=Caldilinea sp. TaxID=2293560 RepID=UPI0021DE9AB0|nr:SH3 domain-containing protein [Caldilinea sp.]GIV70198.1 MAG: hypothetical protein KatS3mg048_3060 [Caldilinea sp.]